MTSSGWSTVVGARRETVEEIRADRALRRCPRCGDVLVDDGHGGLACAFDGWSTRVRTRPPLRSAGRHRSVTEVLAEHADD